MPRKVLIVGFLLSLAMWAPAFCVPPMESILKDQLALSHAQTSLLFSAPYFVIAAVAIPGGILADRIGMKRAAGIGIILIALGSALRAVAGGFWPLLGFTVLYGVGFALAFTNLPKLVASRVAVEKSGIALGIVNTGMSVGAAAAMALTMSVVFPLTNTYSGTFLIWSIPAIVVAVLWWSLVKEPPRPANVMKERHAYHWRSVLANKRLWLIGGLLALGEFFFMNWAAWYPSLLVFNGATLSLAGLITSLTIWVEVPTLLLMPRLAYRAGVRKPFLWATSLAIVFAIIGAINSHSAANWLPVVVVGIANVTRFITILSLPFDLVSHEQLGAASGIILAMGYLAGGIGPFVGGRILDVTGSLDTAFLALLGVAVAATALSFAVPETGRRARREPVLTKGTD